MTQGSSISGSDSEDQSILYLGLDGLYISIDKGNSWRDLGYSGHENRIKASRLFSNRVYAIVDEKNQLLSSSDAGESWQQIVITGSYQILDVEEGEENILYAVGTLPDDYEKLVFWKSYDNGETWSMRSDSEGFTTDSHNNEAKIVIDPHEVERIFVGAKYLLVSENQGKLWHRFADFE